MVRRTVPDAVQAGAIGKDHRATTVRGRVEHCTGVDVAVEPEATALCVETAFWVLKVAPGKIEWSKR